VKLPDRLTLPMDIKDCRQFAVVVSEQVAATAEQSAPVTFRPMEDGRCFTSASVLSETGPGQAYEALAGLLSIAAVELVPWGDAVALMVDPPAGGSLSPVPASVSARQIRLWLVTHGIPLDTVDATIDSIADQATRDTVRVEWDYAPYVERSHVFLVPLAAALGLDEAAVDQAFREAATL